MVVDLFITFDDGHLADGADLANLRLVDAEVELDRHEVDDARRDGVRRVLRDEVLLFNLQRDELRDARHVRRELDFGAVALDERVRARDAVLGPLLELVDDLHRVRAAFGRAGAVQIEHVGDLLRRARAILDAAGEVDGGGNDAVAVIAAERFVLRNDLMVAARLVDDHFRDSGDARHGGDVLVAVVERLFRIRHRLPARVPLDLAHLVGRPSAVENDAAERRFAQEVVHGHPAPRRVLAAAVVAVVAPLGGRVDHGLHNAALRAHQRPFGGAKLGGAVRACRRVALLMRRSEFFQCPPAGKRFATTEHSCQSDLRFVLFKS